LGNGGGFVADTNKTSDSLGGSDSDPRIVGDNHLNQNIAGKSFFLTFDFSAPADNHFRLNGDDGLEDLIFKVHGADTGFESIDDFIFVTRVGVDDIPGSVNAGGGRR